MKLKLLLGAACAVGVASLALANTTVAFFESLRPGQVIKGASQPVWIVDTDRIAIGNETIQVSGYDGPRLSSTCATERHLAKKAVTYLRFEMALNEWSVKLRPDTAKTRQGELYIGDRSAIDMLSQDVLTRAALDELSACENTNGA